MPRKLLTAAAATLGALTIAACGSGDHDGHRDSAQTPTTETHGAHMPATPDQAGRRDQTAAGNGVDRAFVAAMIPHHRSAVAMARIARKRGRSPLVKTLAADIIRTQSDEIGAMRTQDAQLETAGVERGELGLEHSAMGMDMDPATLETADPFDRAFVAMMVPHHHGAIAMAKVELAKGRDPQLKRLALHIVGAQQREITQMQAAQRDRTPNPLGPNGDPALEGRAPRTSK